MEAVIEATIEESMAIGDDRIVKAIVKMREAIATETKESEARVKVIKQQREQLETELLRRLLARGATQTKTQFGTAFIDESMQAKISDEEVFRAFVRESGDLDFYQKRIKVEHLREYMREHGDSLPPGISIFKEQGITVRTK